MEHNSWVQAVEALRDKAIEQIYATFAEATGEQ